MVLTSAKTKYVRVSPRKARIAAGLIRKKPVIEAMFQLKHSSLKGAKLLLKTLTSAMANAENNHGARRENLVISEVRVDEGPFHKRAWSRSKGRRSLIQRKTSHLYIALDT